MKRTIYSLITVMALALAGCAGGPSTERKVDSDGKSIGITTFSTGHTPRESVNRAVTIMKRLQLQGDTEGGLFGFGGTDWPVKSDYYSASAKAKTAGGDAVIVTATWVDEGKSEMKVRSTLTDTQHQNLADQIYAAMK